MGINPFQKLKAALGDVSAMHRELQAKREKVLQRVDYLHHAAPTKQDIIDFLHGEVDRRAEDFNERFAVQLKTAMRGGEMGSIARNFPILAPNSGRSFNDVIGVSIYGLFGPLLKEALSRIVNDMDLPEPGPSIAERRAELAKLNEELAGIEKELAELEAAASAAGITIQ